MPTYAYPFYRLVVGASLMVRTDTLRAFSGVDLSTDEFLRIDGTVLGKVIASEEGSPHRHDDDDVRPTKDKDESDKDEPGRWAQATCDREGAMMVEASAAVVVMACGAYCVLIHLVL